MNILNEQWFLSIFKKKKKSNLSPETQYPSMGQLGFTEPLAQFAKKRLAGEGVGFGDEFVSRSANPVIQSREARFREEELPFIGSQLSSRGLARSAGPNLATDVLTRASQSKERDINETLANLYQANELQKKRDITEGLGTAERFQNLEANLLTGRAGASERLQDKTVEQSNSYEKQDRAQFDKLGVLGLSGVYGAMPSISGTGGGFDVGSLLRGAVGGVSGSQSRILGSQDRNDMIAELFRRGLR